MHLDLYLTAGGPVVPDIHIDEMSEQELRNVMAYLYGAYAGAIRQGLDDSMVEVLMEWYDEAFTALLGVSERFRENVSNGFVMFPGGPKVRHKYLALAKAASES